MNKSFETTKYPIYDPIQIIYKTKLKLNIAKTNLVK